MKIVVDRDKCEGLGMCESMAHEYFEVDDDDQVIIHNEHPAEEDRKMVLAAVNSCPVLALTLEG
jgi:ferredoxin